MRPRPRHRRCLGRRLGTRISEDGKTVWFTIDAASATEEVHDK
jgi:hypothetical protein